MSKKAVTFSLLLIISLSVLLYLFKLNEVPPCINADEAAFGYNAYSFAQTLRDEYGRFLPLRMESFRDYKLPLYSFLSAPIMLFFGLSDFSTRLLNILVGIAFIPLSFFLSKEIFGKNKIAIITAFLLSLTPWIYILTRHAHEGPLCTFFILLSALFVLRFSKKRRALDFMLTNTTIILATFSYHTGRIFLLLIVLYQLGLDLRFPKVKLSKKIFLLIIVLGFVLFVSFIGDLRYGTNRVNSLLFSKDRGFILSIDEYRREHPIRLIHNKLTRAVRDVSVRYIKQISPGFLVLRGDTSWRFGYKELGLITPFEYLAFFIGVYFLFLHKQKYRYHLLFFTAFSAIPNALTWQEASLIRSYTMVFPILMVSSYGVYHLLKTALAQKNIFTVKLFVGVLLFLHAFFFFYNWDVYFFHYAKRGEIIRAWQCGYKEIVKYVDDNYDKFDRFHVTDRHGQPYIFFLYYLKYDPLKYQAQAAISSPDKYGFGQVAAFDKFTFHCHFDKESKKEVYIGYPDELSGVEMSKEQRKNLKKIYFGTEELFWIIES